MKKIFLSISLAIITCFGALAQGQYLVFEFMKVEEGNGGAYWETEMFWSKIHEQRIAAGDIEGWDFWSLMPGTPSQGHQYMTVTLYDDPVKMMEGMTWEKLIGYAKKAYPNMKEEEIMETLNNSGKSRSLDSRMFVKLLGGTTGDWEMKEGIVGHMDFMQVPFNEMDAYDNYETAEMEVFKPQHQKAVDQKGKLSWSLGRVIAPLGSEAYASHLTFNFFKDWDQFFNAEVDNGEPSEAMMKKVKEGLMTRDMKWSYMGKANMVVR